MFGDFIKDYNFNQYKNVLVYHSYHYHYPPKLSKSEKSRGVWPETYDGRIHEIYEREIGFELEKLNLPNVVVREVDNRKRDVNYLLKKYKSRFMLDLHDPGRSYNQNDRYHAVADIIFSRTKNHLEYFEKFCKQKYPDDKNMLKPKVRLLDTTWERFNPRLIGVELFTWCPKDTSLDFLKRFTNYLQSNDL